MASGKLPYRNRLLIGLLVGGAVLAGVSTSVGSKSNPRSATDSPRREQAIALIDQTARDGDLIFRSGRDMVSTLVLSQSKASQYSHVGIIVRDNNDRVWVIHSIPKEDGTSEGHGTQDGVINERLADFASSKNASGFGLYRAGALTGMQRYAVQKYASRQIGKEFDDAFSFTDNQRMYCTELAVKSYQRAGMDLAEHIEKNEMMTLNEPVIVPDALAAAPELHAIITFKED